MSGKTSPRRPAPPGSSGGNSSARAAFQEWFAEIWNEQVGPARDGQARRFKDEEAFRVAFGTHMSKSGVTGGTPDRHTIQNWRNRPTAIQERFVAPLFDTLQLSGHARDAAQALWHAAEDERKAATQANRQRSIHDDPDPGASDWIAEAAEPLQPGLAELLVYPPPAGRNTPNLVPLRVALSFAECDDVIEDHDVTLALTDATLVPAYAACAPQDGSRAGEAGNPCDHLALKAGIWHVQGPRTTSDTAAHNAAHKASGKHLDGEPLGAEQPLLTLRADDGEKEVLTLTLRSNRRALQVLPNNPDRDPGPLKTALLQILLQKTQAKDRDGFITWGRVSLRRKPREPRA